jgi:hypothetical protein
MIMLKEDADEELADITKEKLSEILKMDDKVKAAKQLELLVMQDLDLPREYYFAGVKDKAGNESIALRWKYTRSGGKGQTVEITKSLINIYDDGENGVWVADFAEDALVELPEEVEKLINSVLEFIGANEGKGKGSYTIGGEKVAKDDDDDKKEDDKDEKDDTADLLGDGDDKDEDKDKDEDDEDDKKDDDSDDSDEDKKKKKKKDKKKEEVDVDDLL